MFLAHLRLIGELIVYQCSGLRRRPFIGVHNFKHLLLQNSLANESQILCGASMGRGNESLFAASGSHDPRWPPHPYMLKPLLKSPEPVE